MKFLKKWREFLGGGNDIWVFLKNGKHPIEQSGRAQQEVRQEVRPSAAGPGAGPGGRTGSRAGRQDREQGAEQEVPHRYIYFPLEIISIVRYRPYQIAIQK